jgi:predicted acylesterase/phospholipase RssA
MRLCSIAQRQSRPRAFNVSRTQSDVGLSLPLVLAGNVADRHLEKAMSASATHCAQKITDDVLVDLALQGGGAHGAFSWGVLDRLLEESGCGSMAFPARPPAP